MQSGPLHWFDNVSLKRNPHRSPLIEEVLKNGREVTTEMLWGKDISDEDLAAKRREVIERAIRDFGVSGEKARAALAEFESR
jgi:hypothetical protein